MLYSQLIKALLDTAIAMSLALPSSGAFSTVISPTIATVIGVSSQAVHIPSSLPTFMANQDSTLASASQELPAIKPVPLSITSSNLHIVRATEAENTKTYVMHCDGDNMGAGQVIDGCFEGLIFYMNGADCHFSCSCNGKGAMSCHVPDKYCGNSLAIASYCGSSHPHFTCYCKPTSYPSAVRRATTLLDHNITPTTDSNDLVLTSSTMWASASQITPLLSSPITQLQDNSGGHQELGSNILVEWRPSTSQRLSQPSQMQRANEIHLLKASALPIDSLVSSEGRITPLLCSGTDLKKKYYVGVCTDGTLMYWSSSDCQSNCKCSNSGELQCDVDSGCGPANAVAKACISEATFTCTCVSQEQQNERPVLALL